MLAAGQAFMLTKRGVEENEVVLVRISLFLNVLNNIVPDCEVTRRPPSVRIPNMRAGVTLKH
jgi:hypothetical protein